MSKYATKPACTCGTSSISGFPAFRSPVAATLSTTSLPQLAVSGSIISGGYNVYPREVEDALLTHPSVREVAVVGTADAKWVEAVTAVVVLEDGTVENDALQASLVAHVGERLASYKKPRRVVFAESIPKTAVGKLNRKALRDEPRDAI